MSEIEDDRRAAAVEPDAAQAPAERPVYRKPKLQRYDQIEQVRPYGPSEV